MTPVHILSVTSRPVLRGTLYKIVASDGQKYSTRDPWRASLCLQALKQGRPVEIWSSAGWFDRDLTHVKLADEPQVSA